MTSETRKMLGQYLKENGWVVDGNPNYPGEHWYFRGLAYRKPGGPGNAGSIFEAIKQQIELEESEAARKEEKW